MKYLGLVAVAVAGCTPHVTVHPMPPNPTPQQRMSFWQQYRPTGELTETHQSCDGRGHCSTSTTKGLIFADGQVVRDPSDLEALVAPTSQTVEKVRSSKSHASNARLFQAAAAVVAIAGLVYAFNAADGSSGEDIGLGVMIGGVLIGGIGMAVETHRSHADRDAAYQAYPHDLADQLHLCINGIQVVPCEMSTPGSAPAPDPNLDQLRQR